MNVDDKCNEILIAAVERYNELYDKSNKNYKDYILKENCWINIADEMGTSVEIAKRRWDNLRDRFVRAYRELTETRNVKKKTNTFVYLDMMMWLAPYIRKRRITSVWNDTKRAYKPEFDLNESISQPAQPSTSTDIEEGVYEVYEEDRTLPNSPTSFEVQIEENKLQRDISKVATSLTNYIEMQGVKSHHIGKTADQSFMNSIVEDMQYLPFLEKIKFKTEVQQLLQKYILAIERDKIK